MKNLQENLEILRKIDKKKDITQRELAKDMGLSLGKLNYCLNGLKKKGLIKINNFKKNKKIRYVYLLTQGVATKIMISMIL